VFVYETYFRFFIIRHGRSLSISDAARASYAVFGNDRREFSSAIEQRGLVTRPPPSPAHHNQTPSPPSQIFCKTLIRMPQRGKEKGEPGGSPFPNLLCRPGSAQNARMFRERRAPQKRCDQLWFSSKPGGVMFPPELNELTPRLYSSNSPGASEDLVNSEFRGKG
jgi:hypothetical protein